MRLLSITVVGAALVAAGLVAPASGAAGSDGGMRITPEVARPGERVRLETPSCEAGLHRVESTAFEGRARLSGRKGRARLKPSVGAGTYEVVADCGFRRVTGRLTVSTERSWPSLLPGALNPQMARATNGDH